MHAIFNMMKISHHPAPSQPGRESSLRPAYPHNIHCPPESYPVAVWVFRSIIRYVERVREGEKHHIHITFPTVYCYNCSISLLLLVFHYA